MNKNIKRIAENAGFVFWEDEEWGPGPDHIDWASNYDQEFNIFCESLIEEIVNRTLQSKSDFSSDIIKQIIDEIKDDYT